MEFAGLKSDPSISVVIPVFNEAENLPFLLDSLFRQTMLPNRVIITDAGSSDASREIMASWATERPEITILHEPGAYPGRGRNLAVASVDSELIAQIDGGSTADPAWLEKISRPIVEGKADYVTGAVLPMPIVRTILGREIDLAELYAVTLFSGARSSGVMAGGSSVAYRRCIWEQVGGFPEWARTSEDRMFAAKAAKGLPRTTFVADALVYWQLGPGLADFWRRLVAAAANHVLMPPFRSTRMKPLVSGICLAGAVVLSFVLTPLVLLLPFLGLAMLWMRRWISAGKRLRMLSTRNSARSGISSLILAGLALVKLAAQFSGLTRGLLRWPERRRNHLRYMEYIQEK